MDPEPSASKLTDSRQESQDVPVINTLFSITPFHPSGREEGPLFRLFVRLFVRSIGSYRILATIIPGGSKLTRL